VHKKRAKGPFIKKDCFEKKKGLLLDYERGA